MRQILRYFVNRPIPAFQLECSQHTNWTKLHSSSPTDPVLKLQSLNTCNGIHLLRTSRALTVPVSQQPINSKYSRDADVTNERVRRRNWVDLFRSVQFSSCAVNKPQFIHWTSTQAQHGLYFSPRDAMLVQWRFHAGGGTDPSKSWLGPKFSRPQIDTVVSWFSEKLANLMPSDVRF